MSTTTPVPATTSNGTALPVVALPQGELLTVNANDMPLIVDSLGPGVHFKPLRLDLELGEWVVLATFAPGVELPLHYHTGAVDAYTLSGSWHYVEYPKQVQTAGSYLYEPGASVHTFKVPEDNTEDTVVWFRVCGANINFNPDGTFHSILDAALIAHLTNVLGEAQGHGKVNYIGGGAADFTADA
ncbi:2,4'-dihydroxyacetophenone dioxygenase family protein [Nocardioides stalactiti]|uniref:2,4'-dihydroxyacetophenone dioxygenase family protein n=1 Tax=Nocardioides stalactiti TaxID=2755356 RepID=UPI001602AC85|nr:2,4'-dihydroxyacetophenone dioxygenase family protein [Nocardioides stalactiti]